MSCVGAHWIVFYHQTYFLRKSIDCLHMWKLMLNFVQRIIERKIHNVVWILDFA